MKNGGNLGSLSFNPIFVGVAGVVIVGGMAYIVSRDNANRTIVRPEQNAVSGSSNTNTTTTPTTPTSPTSQTSRPTLLMVSATQIKYSGILNGATIHVYFNGSKSGLTHIADGNPWNGLSLVRGAYTITATENRKTESLKSNGINFSNIIFPPGPTTNFPNVFQNIPIVTDKNSLPLNVFSDFQMPTHTDNIVGAIVPNLMVVLHSGVDKLFYAQGIDFQKRGIFGSPYFNHINGVVGYETLPRLTRCVDFIYTQDPNTGLVWNVDTQCNIAVSAFVTALPYNKRIRASSPRTNSSAFFDTATDQQLRDEANRVAFAHNFGNITENGKDASIEVNIDMETGYETGMVNNHKARVFLKTCADKIKGYFFVQYLQVIKGLSYLDKTIYPDANGNIPTEKLNPLVVETENLDGIPNYSILDSDNMIFGPEVSQWQESTFPQGFNDGMRIINHFGNSANTEHYLAKIINILECHYYFLRSKGKANRMGAQVKIVCDRGNVGLQYSNGNRPDGRPKSTNRKEYLTREQSAMAMLMTFMCGVWIEHPWDDPLIDAHLDPYNGFIGALAILSKPRDFGGGNTKSFAELRLNGEFELWETEVSYDGVNFVKEKGCQYAEASSSTEARVMRNGNYLAVCACRAYLIEPENITIRYAKNGFNFTKIITSDDWQSVYPNGTDKSYYFDIFKMA